ncbi:hypothetical protein A2884_01670 [Candidatus Saccharibacteria bacterium RIFCSPHIGHO2_01_FULL_48_12]|nr:MAG: hypothetical protein A2884_01670 [Candidatus Saccharibacteria bacterium RIFCSPHIGHO2_01_FULL_48_12]OGL36056.1 MAG: hypothetical protein A3F38_02215 [Candidatus Saccharibacteria bacterium RIFCSPHIGHO2_12_FULL_48_21]
MNANRHNQLLEAVRNYRIPAAAEQLIKQHPPLLIAGASSVGKNTITDKVVTLSNHRRVITHTTRQPWGNEVDGVTYWFVEEGAISRMIDNQALIEAQLVHGETIYATSVEAYEKVVNSGFQPLLIVDIHGLIKYLRMVPAARAFFLLPPTFEEWMHRFERRGPLSFTQKRRRLHSAKLEMELVLKTPQVQLLVNDDITQTAKSIIGGPLVPATQAQHKELAQRLIDHARVY